MERIINEQDERTWGMLCHLSAFAGCIIPFGNIIGPIIIYSLKRKEFPFVEDQGRESLNFQITFSILFLISLFLYLIVIGIFLSLILGLLWLIFTIIAALKANQGEYFRYPFSIRFLK